MANDHARVCTGAILHLRHGVLVRVDQTPAEIWEIMRSLDDDAWVDLTWHGCFVAYRKYLIKGLDAVMTPYQDPDDGHH
jgi:hypothetical protein